MTETRKLIDRIILDECEYCSGAHCLSSGCLYWDILEKLKALEFIESLPSVDKLLALKKPLCLTNVFGATEDGGEDSTPYYLCPSCGEELVYGVAGCPYCDQCLDWERVE